MTKQKRPYGSWPSSISAQFVGGKQVRFGHMQVQNNIIYWLEGRPEEAGRVVLMMKEPGQAPIELTSSNISVKSKVHEYGGGDFVVSGDHVFFVNDFDQNIYDISQEGMTHLTHEYDCRFADIFHDVARNRLLAVCEDHGAHGHLPENKIVAISLGEDKGVISDVFRGDDFYARPTISDCGGFLSYVSWSRPFMPWDAAAVHVMSIDEKGHPTQPIYRHGGSGQAVFQPTWHRGNLYFVYETGNWSNICISRSKDQFSLIETLWESEADFGRPQWAFGQRSFAFLDETHIVASYFENGHNKCAVFDLEENNVVPIDHPFLCLEMIDVAGGDIVGFAASEDKPTALVSIPVEDTGKTCNIIRSSADTHLKAEDISKGKQITFPTRDGSVAHGLYYHPQNVSYEGLDGTSPPMIVSVHGGPTGMADRGLKLKIQYWTSRGFSYLDVDYRGSSGYGKMYREALNGQWGVLDVTDAIDGALWCVSEGLADKNKLIISGSSAGGLTVLNALAHHDVFHAGACYYAVSDLRALCADTHKFEVDYVYNLTGTTADTSEAVFKTRSPRYHFTDISAPVIFFQGDNDPIVPASQSRHMFSELNARGSVVAYTEFAGEGHGFRQVATIKTALSQEYYFYGKILGFDAYFEEEKPEVNIKNL